MTSVSVTTARPEDSHAIAAIHVASWQAAYATLLPAGYLASMSVAERESSWAAILETSASRTLVARRGADSVGFITLGHCRDRDAEAGCGEIWALYVAPEAWSSGVGWALWEAARVAMLHRGCVDVSLWVLEDNPRGRRFYESVGFRQEPATHEQFFERGGVKLAEVRLVFSGMSAHPLQDQPRPLDARSRS